MKFPAALPDNLYADPARIYADAEQRTCKGCVWIQQETTSIVEHCAKGERFGKRCRFYSEKKNAG